MQFLNGTKRITTAVMVVCAFLSSSAFAEVLHGKMSTGPEYFDLETGEVHTQCRRCDPILPPEVDFQFTLIRDEDLVYRPKLELYEYDKGIRELAIFDEQTFDSIGFSDIENATFSSDDVGFVLEPGDTLILLTDTGAYYKIGNAVYDGISLMNFDYEELTDEVDTGRVFLDGFENP